MVDRGEQVGAHMTIAFVIGKTGGTDPGERARIPDEIPNVRDADIEWYLVHQVMAPVRRLCEPFGGLDMRMIAGALAIALPQSVVPPPPDPAQSPVDLRTTEMQYRCGKCRKIIILREGLKEHLRCPKCRFQNPWKYVANSVIKFARAWVEPRKFVCDGNLCNFTSRQMPITGRRLPHSHGCRGKIDHELDSTATFTRLRHFASMFTRPLKKDDRTFEKYREYVSAQLKRIIWIHGFARIQLSSIMTQFSPQSSEGLCSISPFGTIRIDA
jgi:DNA-directed RNA polymerase subunit RPC12/RpoP